MPSLSREQVRAIDRCAIDTVGVPGVVLMENAGRQLADAACHELDALGGGRVAIVAGAGNNGGDGFVLARHLLLRGIEATVFLTAPPGKLSDDAETNYRVLVPIGADVRAVAEDDLDSLADELDDFALVVDAVGGTGITGVLRGAPATVVEQINAAGRPVLAVDIPTGLDADTGGAEGPVVRARATVTFVARKTGFDADGADAFTGEVRVADIGIPAERVLQLAESS